MMGSYPLFAPHDNTGRLKVIAVAGDRRLSVRPDIPTVSESGVPGHTVISWFATMACAGRRPVRSLKSNGESGFHPINASVELRIRRLAGTRPSAHIVADDGCVLLGGTGSRL